MEWWGRRVVGLYKGPKGKERDQVWAGRTKVLGVKGGDGKESHGCGWKRAGVCAGELMINR